MEMLNGDKIGKLPFKDLEKVADLIYYEGPILSHFKDKFNKDILFYWVDYNNLVNRWLIFQVTEAQLYKYLLSKNSLLSLFQKPVNDIFYTVEIADKLEYNNVTQIINGDLPHKYIPEIQSYFSFEIPSVYNKILQYKESDAIEIFKAKAFYIKAKPKTSVNHGLIGAMTGGFFLTSLGKSFKALIINLVKRAFVERGIVDKKRIKEAIDYLIEYFQPNIVNTNIASFGIALSPNDLSEPPELFLNREWRQSVFEKFKTDVIEIDTKNVTEVDAIVNSYKRDEDITGIYKPIIELYNSNEIDINITDSNFVEKRLIKHINEDIEIKLTSIIKTPKKENEKAEFDRFGLIKVDEKGHLLNKKPTLFEFGISSAWPTTEIILEKKSYKLNKKFLSDYRYENNVHIIENNFFGIFASGEDYTETVGDFYRQFDTLYNLYINSEPETLEGIAIKATLETLVPKNEDE